MSHHYSASQFNDSFKPTRLNNYSAYTNTPAPYGVHAMCLPNRCCPTQIIADDNGKLFDCICRGASSPWGDYSTWIWEQSATCLCIDRLRHPEKYAPPRHIFIAREENCAEKEEAKLAKYLNSCPEAMCDMARSNAYGCGGADPCRPRSNPRECIPMTLAIAHGEIERKRLISEIRRQQREYRRCVAGTRGRFKGIQPFCPGELRLVTWNGCGKLDNGFRVTRGCRK